MPEHEAVSATPEQPLTRTTLAAEFRAAGVPHGGVLMVHSSLRQLGVWVIGGPLAVLQALEDALGPDGTLVMPTFSADLSDPAPWQNPPIPESWWPLVREHMPAFDPARTPTRMMGQLVEVFRSAPGTLRSSHPQTSFAARGPQAEQIITPHPIECRLGESSPLRRLYDLQAHVLLLGVGHGNNTCLHLAEYRAEWPSKTIGSDGAPVFINSQRQWVTFSDLENDEGDFPQLGADLERETKLVRLGKVGQATTRLFPLAPMVDYGVNWINQHR